MAGHWHGSGSDVPGRGGPLWELPEPCPSRPIALEPVPRTPPTPHSQDSPTAHLRHPLRGRSPRPRKPFAVRPEVAGQPATSILNAPPQPKSPRVFRLSTRSPSEPRRLPTLRDGTHSRPSFPSSPPTAVTSGVSLDETLRDRIRHDGSIRRESPLDRTAPRASSFKIAGLRGLRLSQTTPDSVASARRAQWPVCRSYTKLRVLTIRDPSYRSTLFRGHPNVR